MTKDPYTLVHECLWKILESSPEFSQLVKPANRTKLTGPDRSPLKREVSVSDMPNVAIISDGNSPDETRSTDHFSDAMRTSIVVLSGDQRLDPIHYPIKWIIFRLMMAESVECKSLGTLQWMGETFVTGVTVKAATDRVAESEVNLGIRGWSQVWAFEIQLSFSVAKIIEFSRG